MKKTLYTFVCLIFPLTAAAADFTLNVPLRVENVPSMQTVKVSCLVSAVRVGEPYASGRTNVVGRGETSVRPVGGRYNGTVRVEVNATGINPASAGQSYICSLSAWGNATTGSTYAAQRGNLEDVYERATGHELERYTTSTKANF